MQPIQDVRRNIALVLEQCDVPYKVVPLDEDLYKECIDYARQYGYPVDGDRSVQTYLRQGVAYAANAGGHLPRHPTQICIALYTSCGIFIDEMINCSPEEMSDVYLFNERFTLNEPQGNAVLDAFADIIRRVSRLYPPVASHLITTATLDGVTANLLEAETRSMKISRTARLYPTFQRILSGVSRAYGLMVFPREVPLCDYIQAIPNMVFFINNINDLFSFYKEERAAETTNYVSTQAARTNKPKSEILDDLTESVIILHKGIMQILEESPGACEAFKCYTAGFIYFHTSSGRYQLEDLGL